jgi:hypothetical protein
MLKHNAVVDVMDLNNSLSNSMSRLDNRTNSR